MEKILSLKWQFCEENSISCKEFLLNVIELWSNMDDTHSKNDAAGLIEEVLQSNGEKFDKESPTVQALILVYLLKKFPNITIHDMLDLVDGSNNEFLNVLAIVFEHYSHYLSGEELSQLFKGVGAIVTANFTLKTDTTYDCIHGKFIEAQKVARLLCESFDFGLLGKIWSQCILDNPNLVSYDFDASNSIVLLIRDLFMYEDDKDIVCEALIGSGFVDGLIKYFGICASTRSNTSEGHWVCCNDEDSGQPYYYHTVSMESSWDPPADLDSPDKPESCVSKALRGISLVLKVFVHLSFAQKGKDLSGDDVKMKNPSRTFLDEHGLFFSQHHTALALLLLINCNLNSFENAVEDGGIDDEPLSDALVDVMSWLNPNARKQLRSLLLFWGNLPVDRQSRTYELLCGVLCSPEDPIAESKRWFPYCDDNTGFYYFMNNETGESQWDAPCVWLQQQSEDGSIFYFNAVSLVSQWEVPDVLAGSELDVVESETKEEHMESKESIASPIENVTGTRQRRQSMVLAGVMKDWLQQSRSAHNTPANENTPAPTEFPPASTTPKKSHLGDLPALPPMGKKPSFLMESKSTEVKSGLPSLVPIISPSKNSFEKREPLPDLSPRLDDNNMTKPLPKSPTSKPPPSLSNGRRRLSIGITNVAARIDVPPNFLCSLTGNIMKVPVQSPYGHWYEKDAILNKLKESNTNKCPLTDEPLAKEDLKFDEKLQERIEEWKFSKFLLSAAKMAI
eukprot:TRINITY_DN202094_c0_g1_i1.p1 TRINITY_DN202094_c0_g1~~TRINITY_DN202094_c0_g1_i1.p1  ORF type:complete len:735 (-),score=153.51 TRINITY_DN202094_c0_g1_i1:203-2407(-)